METCRGREKTFHMGKRHGERQDMESQMIDYGGSEQTTDRYVNTGSEKAV